MRKLLLLIVVTALAVAVLTTVPATVHSAADVAPQVIDTNPTRGEELPLSGNITFYFDEPMDQPSVEAAFHTAPDVPGALTWANDSTLVFKPSAPFNRATEYLFFIASSAKSKAGVTLRDNFKLYLKTPGALEVAQVLPANNAKDIEATPTITVIFNRPVVPLGPIDEMKKLPSPITISPAADGAGEWLSTSIYTFKPSGLHGGTTYTVTVNKGLTDLTGSVLANDFKWSFSTTAPRVIEIHPEDGTTFVLRDQYFEVTFNQPMDHTATESAFSFTGANNSAVAGDFTWNDTSNMLTFTPKALLDYNTTYTLRVSSKTARSASGGVIIGPDAVAKYTTIALPDIINTNPLNGDTVGAYGSIEFSFSAPMEFKDFKSRVTIDPKPATDTDFYADDQAITATLNYRAEPSTDYTVTIDVNGLVDRYGTPLTPNPKSKLYSIVGPGKLQIKYTTKAYDPEASLKTGGTFGLYSAYRPTTQVYSTHRNISQIDLGLWSMPIEDFLKLATNNYDFRGSYLPKTMLREWTLQVENPLNVLRYDLLTITDQGPSNTPAAPSASASCVGAPASRLKIGDQGVVLSDDPRPLRLRQTPGLKGKESAQIKPGVQFIVIDGPQCADSYIWWKITTLDQQYTGWAAEGDTQHYFIGLATAANPAQPSPTPQPVATQSANAAQGSLKPGAYLLTMDSPQIDGSPETHYMLVATANITLKLSQRHALAWVTDLQSGQPLAGVNVQFYMAGQDAQGAPVINPINAPVASDSNGLANIDLPNPLDNLYQDVFAVAKDGTNLGVGSLSFSDGIDPYDFNLTPDFYPQSVSAYLYTDRSLYRPGQPVYFRGVLRSRDDVKYGPPPYKTVPVQVMDDSNQVIYQKDVPVNAFGTFSDSFTIDESAPLGGYRIVVRPGFDPARLDNYNNYSGPQFERDIAVAQYRVPEFQVKLTADQPQVVQGDKIKVTVDSSFFFGGPLSNAKVHWIVTGQDYFFNYTGSNGNYSFYDFNEDEGYSEASADQNQPTEIADGYGTTDANGKFTVEVPADLGKAKQSQTFTIEADVMDESDQTIAATVDVVVNQGEFYIGAVPEDYVGVANQPQKVDLISVGWDSKPQPNTDLSVRVVERQWKSVQTVEPDTGRTVWDTKVEEQPITDGVIKTDGDGKAVYSFTPPHGGVYKVYVTSRDTKGNQITTSAFLWVAGPDYVPWRQQNSNRIDLKIDKDNYKVGETASVLIASPFQGDAMALVTVERGHLIKTDVIKMTTNSTVYQLPITDDMAPDAFVSVMIVKGVDAKNPVASFRMGLVQLGVQTDRLNLNITVTPDKPQAGPRDTVNYKIHVADYQGKPVQAEVGVGLTDLAVLSLLPDTSTPIMQYFYGKQGLSVRTGSSLVISVDQQTQEILSTIKGGGGGGPEGGIFQVRQRFVDTPLWNPTVTTDANGDATVTVTLPDNLTTWRLDARAVTIPSSDQTTTLVGQTLTDLISTKPLLIRPVTPRFYVVGDQSTLAAVVNNNTGADQDVTVKVDVKGATLGGDASHTANIKSGQRMRFEWPITVQDTDAVSVTFFANSADNKYTDAAKSAVGQGDDKTLPVTRYIVPETVGTGGVIGKDGGDQTEGIVLPPRYNITKGTLDIRLDRSLAATAIDSLNALDNDSSQDTEATISRVLPNLATYGALKKLGLDNPDLKNKLNKLIDQSVQRLYAEQHSDGGWGWFVEDDSNVIVTAYALIGLTEASKQGFNIDKAVITNGIKFVQQHYPNMGDQAQTWELNRGAFLVYALARSGAPDNSATTRLFQIRDKMSNYARAYLAMTFHIIEPKSTTHTDPLMSDLQNHAITSATGQHWEEDYQDWYNWNTDTRTTAIVLEALIQIQPTNALIPNAIRWLMVARKADAWETTQETAWAVMALTDWMQYTGELKPNYTFSAAINGTALGSMQTASPETVEQSVQLQVQVKDLLAGQVNKLTINRSSGDGLLYYTAHVTAYLPVDQVKAVSRGFTITRSYSLLSDPHSKPITQANVGDSVRVTLNIVVPNDLYYVVITDPIPAGAEAVNPNLATSGTIGKPPELTSTDVLSEGWGWWWFSKTELRDDRTVLYATYLPKGTYEYTYTLRAGLAGVYNVIPTTGQETYFPEVYGRSDGMLFTLNPAPAGAADPTNQQP